MPTISTFHGISIGMFWSEHGPPHFHARYAEDNAVFEIATLTLIEGHLRPRLRRMVLRWAAQHQAALLENWDLCVKRLPLRRIEGLR